ncbi:MAG: hypothetical protein K2M73_05630 [Lachnospiraceae bacterium]|nr:hypothetical protein [Lachnospiraceae bacterium]
MRKIKYLLAVGVMSTSLLFGCGSNDGDSKNGAADITPDEFIEKVEACDTEIKSADFKLSADIDATMTVSSNSSDIKGNYDLSGSYDANGAFKLSVSMSADGQEQTIDCYLIPENDEITMYYKMMDMWYKMTSDDVSDMLGDMVGMNLGSLSADTTTVANAGDYLKKALEYITDTSVSVSDNTYTLKGTIDLNKIIGEIESTANVELSQYSDIINDIKLNVSYSINSSDNTFKSFEISVGEFDNEIEGVNVKLNSLKLTMSAENYNNVSDITIPDDAADAMDISGLMEK